MADIPKYKDVLPPFENLTDGKYTDEECIAKFLKFRKLSNTFKWEIASCLGRYKILIAEDLDDIEFAYVTDAKGKTVCRATLRSGSAPERLVL